MTKSTITREQLLEIIETDHVQCGEASYLARMALAAMDSEPVIVVGDDGGDALSYRRLIQSFEPGTKLYRHAQPVPAVPGKWIPVSERIPEAEGHYLVSANASRIDGYCDHLAIATYQGGEWSNEFNWLVTHWMPLPAAPQEVKK